MSFLSGLSLLTMMSRSPSSSISARAAEYVRSAFRLSAFGGESPFAIVAKDEIKQRPVAALRQDDVEIAVAVDVAKADTRGGFALGLQKEYALEGACFRGEDRSRRLGVDERSRCREEESRQKRGFHRNTPVLHWAGNLRRAVGTAHRGTRLHNHPGGRRTKTSARITPAAMMCRTASSVATP